MSELSPLLEPLGVGTVKEGFAGADVAPLIELGVIGVGLHHDLSRYFDIHHTEADTIDKVDPADIRRGAAIMAILAYILADMPDAL